MNINSPNHCRNKRPLDKRLRLDTGPNLSEAEFNGHLQRGSLCFVFTGITGAGKTTIGRRLAASSPLNFVDIDEAILAEVIHSGALRDSVLAFAERPASAAHKSVIQHSVHSAKMPSITQQHALAALPHGALLVAAIGALCQQRIVDLSPLTFLSLSPQGQAIYSQLEARLTLARTLHLKAKGNHSFSIVSASGSLSTLDDDVLSAVREASIFVHFKSNNTDLQQSLAQAAHKPMVLEPGKDLRQTLELREGFYQRLSHLSIARSTMWQLQHAKQFLLLVRKGLFGRCALENISFPLHGLTLHASNVYLANSYLYFRHRVRAIVILARRHGLPLACLSPFFRGNWPGNFAANLRA